MSTDNCLNDTGQEEHKALSVIFEFHWEGAPKEGSPPSAPISIGFTAEFYDRATGRQVFPFDLEETGTTWLILSEGVWPWKKKNQANAPYGMDFLSVFGCSFDSKQGYRLLMNRRYLRSIGLTARLRPEPKADEKAKLLMERAAKGQSKPCVTTRYSIAVISNCIIF